VDYLAPTVYVTDLLIVFLLVSWITHSWRSIKGLVAGSKDVISNILHRKYAIVLMVFVAVNIVVSASKPVAVYKWLKVGEFAALGWYMSKTRPSLSRITYPLSLGVLYTTFIAVAQFIVQHSVGLWIVGERTFAPDTPAIARVVLDGREMLRAYATFPHPNVLGGYVAVLLPLFIYKSAHTQRYKFTTILGVLALVLTFSRSAWVATLVGFGIMRRKFLLPALLGVLMVLFTVNATEESVVIRRQLNASALSMWKTSPIVGVGLGNFLVELPKYMASRDVYFLQPVHNTYLLILAETGVVGFVFFLLLLGRRVKELLGGRKGKHGRLSARRTPQYLSLFLLLLLGFIDHYPLTIQQGQLLLTLLLVIP